MSKRARAGRLRGTMRPDQYRIAAAVLAVALIGGCGDSGRKPLFDIRPHKNTCEVILAGPAGVGEMRLWVPEGIATNSGFSSVYPVGQAWVRHNDVWTHEVTEAGLFGPVYEPDPVPTQPSKSYPSPSLAEIWTTEPAFLHAEGETLPPVSVLMVRKNWRW